MGALFIGGWNRARHWRVAPAVAVNDVAPVEASLPFSLTAGTVRTGKISMD